MSETDTAFSLAKALLVALFLESVLFGIFAVLYAISIWILIYRQQYSTHRSKINKRLLGTSTIMFVLAVLHIAFNFHQAMEGFITNGGTPTGTTTFFEQSNHPLFVGKSATYITQTLVGDAFVMYRLYIVYNRNLWIAVLPLALLVGTGISGYGIPINVARGGPSETIFSSHLVPWITSFFTLSLTTNVLATILLSGRIMWSNYKVKQYHFGERSSVLETIVQSAALYSAALVSLLATYVAGSNAQYVCLDALQPIIGITFTLIIIRVCLGETASEQSTLKTHRMPVDAAGFYLYFGLLTNLVCFYVFLSLYLLLYAHPWTLTASTTWTRNVLETLKIGCRSGQNSRVTWLGRASCWGQGLSSRSRYAYQLPESCRRRSKPCLLSPPFSRHLPY